MSQSIYDNIRVEREFQDSKWGTEFDDKNTINDWTAYINHYAGLAAFSTNDDECYSKLIKTAALVVAALEAFNRNHGFPKRHYD